MIILNTTFVVERAIYDAFVGWLKELYVPAALATGLFSSSRLAQILSNDEPGVISIACELQGESLSECVRWHDETALLLRNDMAARWGEKAMFFTTYLKKID